MGQQAFAGHRPCTNHITECACWWTVGWDHCRTIMRWTCCNQYHCNPSMIYINIEKRENVNIQSTRWVTPSEPTAGGNTQMNTHLRTTLGTSGSSVLLLHLTWTLTSLTFALCLQCSQTTNHNGHNTHQQTHRNCSNPKDIHFHC